MSGAKEYIRKLGKLSDEIEVKIKEIVLLHEGQLLATVKLRLYQQGLDANLKPLGDYSDVSKKRKKKKGQITSHITLRDTGAWYKSMFIDFVNQEIIVDATDEKTSMLEFIYGESIMGLSEPEVETFIDSTIEPGVQNLLDELGDIDLGAI